MGEAAVTVTLVLGTFTASGEYSEIKRTLESRIADKSFFIGPTRKLYHTYKRPSTSAKILLVVS